MSIRQFSYNFRVVAYSRIKSLKVPEGLETRTTWNTKLLFRCAIHHTSFGVNCRVRIILLYDNNEPPVRWSRVQVQAQAKLFFIITLSPLRTKSQKCKNSERSTRVELYGTPRGYFSAQHLPSDRHYRRMRNSGIWMNLTYGLWRLRWRRWNGAIKGGSGRMHDLCENRRWQLPAIHCQLLVRHTAFTLL